MTLAQYSERQTITVPELGRLLGIGRNSAYLAVERGDVRAIRVGKRVLISKREVDRLLGGGEKAA